MEQYFVSFYHFVSRITSPLTPLHTIYTTRKTAHYQHPCRLQVATSTQRTWHRAHAQMDLGIRGNASQMQETANYRK